MSEEQGNPQENQPVNPVNNDTPSFGPANTPPVTPPPFQQNPQFNQFGGPQNLPNSTIALVLGILSIPACCCYGIFGLILGIIAWVLATGDLKKYALSPGNYSLSSYKNTKAGKVCGIIGTVLGALYLLMIIAFIVIYGFAVLKDPELMKEIMQNKSY